MRDIDEEFRALWRQTRETADATALIERFGPHILRVIRRRLDRRLRSKFDSVDFVQSVWASFFAIPSQECEFESSEDLANFLMSLARNKVVDANRQRLCTKKHNLDQEHALDDSCVVPEVHLAARDPSASHVAMAKEEWEQLVRGQPPRYKNILEAFYAGYTPEEIAADLRLKPDTIRRILRRLVARKCS